MTTEETLIRALADVDYPSLPGEKWDEKDNFTLGIALVQRVGGNKDYVLVRRHKGATMVIKDYNGGLIHKLLEVYACEKREKTLFEKTTLSKENIKTIADAKLFLKGVGYTGSTNNKSLDKLMEIINNEY